MNNVQKFFEETYKGVEEFKKRTEYLIEKAEEKERQKALGSKVAEKAFMKAFNTMQLTINKKMGIVIFEKTGMESYTQPIFVKKRRINVVPLCFMIELYKAGIANIPEAKYCDIPFTLKGFWNMNKIIDCISELVRLRNSEARIVRMLSNTYNDGAAEDMLNKILKSIEALNISNPEYGYIIINYKDMSFKANMGNVKANVVPMCKLVCKYYVDIMNAIKEYETKINPKMDKCRARQLEENFVAFIEKYFIPKMRIR